MESNERQPKSSQPVAPDEPDTAEPPPDVQGSASGVVSCDHPSETTSHVYNIERFQRDGPPSVVVSLAGGATPRDHEDRLRGHMALIGSVDNYLGMYKPSLDMPSRPHLSDSEGSLSRESAGSLFAPKALPNSIPPGGQERVSNRTDLFSNGAFFGHGASTGAEIDINSQYSENQISEQQSLSVGEFSSNRTPSPGSDTTKAQLHVHDTRNHTPGNADDDDDDDTRTEYSVTTNPEDKYYISALAQTLLRQTLELAHATCISTDTTENEQSWSRIFASLPDLLQEFSLGIGHQASKQIQRDVMVFVHRYKRDIAAAFQAAQSSETRSFLRRTGYGPYKASPVSQYLQTSEGATPPESGDLPSDNDSGGWPSGEDYEDTAEERARVRMYVDSIYNEEAYQRLRIRLCRHFLSIPAEPDTMTEIGQRVIGQLPHPQRVSRRPSSMTYVMTFHVEWNPHSFLTQQGYEGDPGDDIANALSFTGSTLEAQAVPCAQYLSETWPLTGEVVCQLIKDIVRDKRGVRHSAEFYDHTRLNAGMEATQLVVKASGTKASLAEIAQQLAWLSCAFPVRLSNTNQSTGAYCTPLLVRINRDNSVAGQVVSEPVWGIRVKTTHEDPQNEISNGQCWTHLVRNRILAQGFPINRRPERGTGVEMALNHISELIQAPYATVFNGKMFIKGPRAMLLLVKQKGNSLVWHLIESQDDSRVTYTDIRISAMSSENVSLSKLKDLESARHFVGWCSETTSLVGTPRARYDIGVSDFELSQNCSLQGRPISPGVNISRERGFSVPQNLNAINSRACYIQSLNDLTKESVALFDSDDKRSWLVDGVSVLLHLARASLKRDEDDPITRSWYRFKMKEGTRASQRSDIAAFSILMDPINLKAPLHDTPMGAPETFGQRVEKIWSFLEMVIDDERLANGENHACAALEAFEFRHIATVTGPVSRCAIPLPPEGRASINLCRELNAVTLVGSGFGDLIQSKTPAGLCSPWGYVPKDMGYICVQTSHLEHIMDNRTDKQYQLWGRIGNLYWNKLDIGFDERCDCRKGGGCNYARKLWAVGQFDGFKPGAITKGKCNLPPCGAVIFSSYSSFSESSEPNRLNSYGLLVSSGDSATRVHYVSSATTSTHPQSLVHSSSSGLSLLAGSSQTPETDHSQDMYGQEAAPNKRRRVMGTREDSEWKPLFSHQLPQQPVETNPNAEASHRETGSSALDGKPQRPQRRQQFGVVVICALKLEAEAFSDMFDQRWDDSYGQASWDPNAYSTGAIGKHNVVLAHMAGMGKSNATSVAAYVRSSFPNIKLALVVGVCGAVPLPPKREAIVLGDVIISDSVFQYDLGRKHEMDRVVPKKELRESLRFPTCPQLLHLMAKLDTRNERRRLTKELAHHMKEMPRNPDLGAKYREEVRDGRVPGLFHSVYRHMDSTKTTCDECGCNGTASQRERLAQGNPEPVVHIGRLASGDSVIRSAEDRDELARDDIIGLEMEGAGVWDHFPCLVIKGACDYADAGKTKEWQGYAATTAAACAKAFLTLYWEPTPYVG